MSEYEEKVAEKVAFVSYELLLRLFYITTQVALVWGTISFIMDDNPIAGITCFLGFLSIGVMVMARFALNLLSRIGVMVEAGLKRTLLDEIGGRPTPNQIDRLLRCDCDECQEMRERFELPNRILFDSLLTEMEEQDEAEAIKELVEH